MKRKIKFRFFLYFSITTNSSSTKNKQVNDYIKRVVLQLRKVASTSNNKLSPLSLT